MARIGVGIDIAKDTLDVALSDGAKLGSFANTTQGLTIVKRQLAKVDVHRVVVEASGGYERQTLLDLHAAGLPVVLVQPARARHFAKAIGRYAKTDAIDALVLARMAVHAVDDVEVWRPLDEEAAELRALVERRVQLVAMIDAETKRRRGATDSVRRSIEAMLAALRGQLKAVEDDINARIAAIYMATLAATRWNDHIKAFYQRLVRRGKRKKVALVACMRKLLIDLNSLSRNVPAPPHTAPV